MVYGIPASQEITGQGHLRAVVDKNKPDSSSGESQLVQPLFLPVQPEYEVPGHVLCRCGVFDPGFFLTIGYPFQVNLLAMPGLDRGNDPGGLVGMATAKQPQQAG